MNLEKRHHFYGEWTMTMILCRHNVPYIPYKSVDLEDYYHYLYTIETFRMTYNGGSFIISISS
jgi:hypothetical protein